MEKARRLAKLQSAMEYLMTYGWSILIIAVVIAALYELGVFGGSPIASSNSCLAQSGFLCSNVQLNTSGSLAVMFGQTQGTTYTVTGVGCTNSSAAPSSFTSISPIAFYNDQVAELGFYCTLSSNTIGTALSGTLWVQYSSGSLTGEVSEIGIVNAKSETSSNLIGSAITTGEAASIVLGQATFVTNGAGTTVYNLTHMNGMAFDSHGDLWVADSNNNRILEYTPPFITNEAASVVIGQTGFTTGSPGITQNTLSAPVGMAFDSHGDLWVTDEANSRILEFVAANLVTNGYASVVLGQPNFVTNAAADTQNTLHTPFQLAFDSGGNLWVADEGNARVLEYAAANLITNGFATTVIGQTGFLTRTTGTTANTLNGAVGIAFDPSGNLWVADTSNNRILEFYSANLVTNGFASTVLGQTSLTTGTSGLTQNTLHGPYLITVDPSDNLWATDYANNRILEYYSANLVTNGYASIAIGQTSFTSGAAGITASTFHEPLVDTIDPHGDLWVADYLNNRILEYVYTH